VVDILTACNLTHRSCLSVCLWHRNAEKRTEWFVHSTVVYLF